MAIISIEQYSEQIYHAKTKEYFQEVYHSYVNESLRSSTVMLYSVVICDLIYKLQELVERYEDEKAKSILSEISEIKERNDKSSEWENKLVELIYERTNLLENHEFINIKQLKDHRNLSAHPVLDKMDILFKPTPETVRAHIRNMLEGVLLKSPILSNEIIQVFIEDIASIKETFPNTAAIERYLTKKYLIHFNEELEKRTIKALWKFIFKLKNQDCNENREINYKVIKIIINRNRQEIIRFISEDSAVFSDVTDDYEIIEYLVEFLKAYPEVYNFLEEHAKVIINKWVDNNIGLLIKASFLSDSSEQHFTVISEKVIEEDSSGQTPILSLDEAKNFQSFASEFNFEKQFITLMITRFSNSYTYDTADNKFQNEIFPFLEKYDYEDFINLLTVINSNHQIHGRRRAIYDNSQIKNFSDLVLGEGFDYQTVYPNFKF